MKFRVFLFSLAVILASVRVDAADVSLNDHDSDYLVRAVAASYPDVSFAARVGIVSVITNRIASDEYPNTAAGAVTSLGDLFPAGTSREVSPEACRMTEDALAVVLAGSDPTGGSVNFAVHPRAARGNRLSARTPLDLFFDNSAESRIRSEILDELSECRIIIDGIGFY